MPSGILPVVWLSLDSLIDWLRDWGQITGPSATAAWSRPARCETSAAHSCEASRANLQHSQESWLVLELTSPFLINFLGGFALNQNTPLTNAYLHAPHLSAVWHSDSSLR